VHGKKMSERGALTNWRAQREARVKARTENEPASDTHSLESADGGKHQDMKKKKRSEHEALTL
jgi:hypothetical protein